MTIKFVIDDYIECAENYIESFGYEINEDDTIEDCAWCLLNWCFYNNHDLGIYHYQNRQSIKP